MAEREDDLGRLQALLAGYSEQALEALSSPGLLRRARKDLDKGVVGAVACAQPGAVTVAVEGETVTVPVAAPQQARCTCPATGLCRHALAALLRLREATAALQPPQALAAGSAETGETPAPLSSALLELTDEALARFAGKAALRRAVALVAGGAAAELTETADLAVRFPEAGVECHLPQGADLAAAIVSGAVRRDHKLWVAAAVLTCWQARGRALPEAEAATTEEDQREAAARAGLLEVAGALLAETVRIGLSNLSSTVQVRYATLSVSALAAGLPRLGRAARALAQEIERVLGRQAQGNEEQLASQLAAAYALCTALQRSLPHPPEHLLGQARTAYTAVGTLELAGVGAYPWVTRSGYAGLTVVFWHAAGREFLTWSEARVRGHEGDFDSLARYDHSGPWSGGGSPRQLAAARLELRHARRNGRGSLSGTAESSARVLGPTPTGALDFGPREYRHWPELLAAAAESGPCGLWQGPPSEDYVVVRPTAWGPRGFEPVTQTLRWALLDATGEALLLEVPYEPVNRTLIEALEAVSPLRERNSRLLGRLVRHRPVCTLFPIALLRPQGSPAVVSLGFTDRPKRALDRGRPSRGARRAAPGGAAPGPAAAVVPAGPALAARLLTLRQHLQRAAEHGLSVLPAGLGATLGALATDLDAAGLTTLTGALHGCTTPEGLLRARYLCDLHLQLLTGDTTATEEGEG